MTRKADLERADDYGVQALVGSIIGFFIFTIILEPIALYFAHKSLQLNPNNGKAVAAKVIAIICLCMVGVFALAGLSEM